ncbi:hypothetical protein C2U72_05570 [Prosthecomicrobium hirschii]|uniref:hypothetical protein n=1 Tax=Prosthecodimorpha hirschii TaxID=665126 RepID=UPI00112D6448|nr:hypothetical protein [Prosthecomicrobium hirschii]TPQ51970.1 hypothetical protein C2U72_05570 [Prosthecomicrobium hirschii]
MAGSIVVSYDGRGVASMLTAATLLASRDRLGRALHEGVRAAGDKTRTVVRKTLHQQMGTKRYGTVVAATRSFIPGQMTYVIEGRGKGLPIIEFPVRGSRAKRRTWREQPRDAAGRFGLLPPTDIGFVTAQPWRVAHTFKRSFVAADGTYKARLPGSTRKRKLFGPSVAKEIVKGATRAAFEATAPREMDVQIGKRLARILP